jgi:hypothetical protein
MSAGDSPGTTTGTSRAGRQLRRRAALPHVVIPDFIRLPPAEVFPPSPARRRGLASAPNAYEAEKATLGSERMPERWRPWSAANAPAYLEFLERLSASTL